jgi:hypothetical protein
MAKADLVSLPEYKNLLLAAQKHILRATRVSFSLT